MPNSRKKDHDDWVIIIHKPGSEAEVFKHWDSFNASTPAYTMIADIVEALSMKPGGMVRVEVENDRFGNDRILLMMCDIVEVDNAAGSH